jgi:ribosome biogenesis GTPase / thiamine phosphate phosphatase
LLQLLPYGWDDRVQALYRTAVADSDDALEPGRVVRVERGGCFVRTPDVEELAVADEQVAVGDWVVIRRPDPSTVLVDRVLPRWSSLRRQDPGRDVEQVLAADLDLVLVTAAADRLNLNRLERELVVAWESGAAPVVVVTKADLVDDPDELGDEARTRLNGCDVIVTSSSTGSGVDEVSAVLQPNRTAVLLGPSGAGKSTLANALLGEDLLATGAVRADDLRGRHTTTSRQLVPLPGGGVLIDTPGLRALPLWRGTDALGSAFADIEELAAGCRFNDCHHDREPGCAVVAAVESGALSEARLASYSKLQREVAFAERQHDRQAQLAEQRRWKSISKVNRQRPRPR